MAFCPLAMIAGKQVGCSNDCEYCPPKDFASIAHYSSYFDYLQYLNFPNDMFGNGMAETGLSEVASALGEVALSIQDLDGAERRDA